MNSAGEVIKDLRLSKLSVNLLARLNSKDLDLQGFMTECAFWAIKDGFDELRLLPLPTCPQRAMEIENMSFEQREKMDFLKVCNQFPQVKYYYDQKLRVINHNLGTLEWLREIKRYIPEEDTITHEKIDNRIMSFKLFEDEAKENISRIKEIFNAKNPLLD